MKKRKEIINKAREQLRAVDPKKYRNVIGAVNVASDT